MISRFGLYKCSLGFIWPCIFPRDCLWKFFLPADYQAMKVTEVAQPGKPRQILAFELRMNIIADATIDLLFTKNRVPLHPLLSSSHRFSLLSLFPSFLSLSPQLLELLSPLCSPLPLVFVFIPHHALAIDIGSCFMLLKFSSQNTAGIFTKLTMCSEY